MQAEYLDAHGNAASDSAPAVKCRAGTPERALLLELPDAPFASAVLLAVRAPPPSSRHDRLGNRRLGVSEDHRGAPADFMSGLLTRCATEAHRSCGVQAPAPGNLHAPRSDCRPGRGVFEHLVRVHLSQNTAVFHCFSGAPGDTACHPACAGVLYAVCWSAVLRLVDRVRCEPKVLFPPTLPTHRKAG